VVSRADVHKLEGVVLPRDVLDSYDLVLKIDPCWRALRAAPRMERSNVNQSCGTPKQESQAHERVILVRVSDSVSEIGSVFPGPDWRSSVRTCRTLCGTSIGGVRSERVKSFTTPWWLWWNILSADAPSVAIVWSLLFASASRARFSTADELVLSLAVWGIYISDRLLDGLTAKSGAALQERHLFCARHRAALVCLVVLAATGSLWVTAELLTPIEMSAGMKLGAIVGAYMAAVHIGRTWTTLYVPKEMAVGILFAAGTTLPVWSQNRGFSWDIWVSLCLFASLCSLNCLAIECWENHRSDDPSQRTPPAFIRWANSRINCIAAALTTLALMLFFVRLAKRSPGAELLAVALAALLIGLLDRHRHRLSGQALRVLADLALVVAGLLPLAT
jgi:hypothetical protein